MAYFRKDMLHCVDALSISSVLVPVLILQKVFLLAQCRDYFKLTSADAQTAGL